MKLIIITIITIIFSNTCSAQTAGTATIAGDTTLTARDTTIPKSTLTIGAVYANNASYYGQKSAESTPYAALAVSYRHKSGIYFTALSYKLLNDKNNGVSATSAGAGVTFKPGKKLSADLNYSHSFYPAYSPLLQAGNADNASVGFTYEDWVNVALRGDYAFGKTADAFVTGGLSKSITVCSLGKKDVVTITPSADVVAGTQHFYQTYVTRQRLKDSLLSNILSPIIGTSPESSTTETVSATSFNVLSYNFKLPLAYNRAHYVLEAAYQFSLLSKQAQSDAGKGNSFVTLSFYYQF
ncbi:MAG: hypothetical protein JWP81_4710 [Ferruginibacter sp.]|nr:hypothetical protein [Ferruginibacter sp.]